MLAVVVCLVWQVEVPRDLSWIQPLNVCIVVRQQHVGMLPDVSKREEFLVSKYSFKVQSYIWTGGSNDQRLYYCVCFLAVVTLSLLETKEKTNLPIYLPVGQGPTAIFPWTFWFVWFLKKNWLYSLVRFIGRSPTIGFALLRAPSIFDCPMSFF